MNSNETNMIPVYTAPMITVIEVEVECGFEGSNQGGGNQLPSWEII